MRWWRFVIGRWHLYAKSGFRRKPTSDWTQQAAFLRLSRVGASPEGSGPFSPPAVGPPTALLKMAMTICHRHNRDNQRC